MVTLDWSDAAHWRPAPAKCRLCRERTRLNDDVGRPCHKVCAEQSLDRVLARRKAA